MAGDVGGKGSSRKGKSQTAGQRFVRETGRGG